MCAVCCRLNPVGEFFYDGSTVNPFEVVFVAMNTLVVENNWSFARQAALYQEWLHLQVSYRMSLTDQSTQHRGLC